MFGLTVILGTAGMLAAAAAVGAVIGSVHHASMGVGRFEVAGLVLSYPLRWGLLQRLDPAGLYIELIGDGDGSEDAPGSAVVTGLFQKNVFAAFQRLLILPVCTFHRG